jgi:iron complex outermembrane receptor protein
MLDGSASWVEGTFQDANENLPRVPPLTGRIRVRHRVDAWTFGVAARGASRQDEVGVFEAPTAAWAALDATVEWRVVHRTRVFQSVALRAQNLTEAEYRNHLSRIKSIMPEAGRSFSLVYQVSF